MLLAGTNDLLEIIDLKFDHIFFTGEAALVLFSIPFCELMSITGKSLV